MPVTHTAALKSMAIPLTALGAGAVVARLVGVFGRVHDPTLGQYDHPRLPDVLAMKTVVSTVIAVLVVAQAVTALWIYGKLGIRAPSWRARCIAPPAPPPWCWPCSSPTTACGRWASRWGRCRTARR